jgi:hypothetical protein
MSSFIISLEEKEVTCDAFGNRSYINWVVFITSIHRVLLQCDTLHLFFGNGNERRHSHICYISKVCHRLYYFICLMVNGMNTESFILLAPIDFLFSVRTFMFEVMEMSEDFPYCFPNTIILYC